jgi:anti-anti-sigma factor
MNDEAGKKEIIKVVLDGELTIQRAHQLRETLYAQLPMGKVIDLDLTQATAIDVSGFQLLCSAHRTAIQNGGDLRIASQRPELLTRIAQTAGFSQKPDCLPNGVHPCLWKPRE